MLPFEDLDSGSLLTLVQVLSSSHGIGDEKGLSIQMRPYVGCVPQGPVEQTLSGISDNLMEQIMMEKSCFDQVWNNEGELRQPRGCSCQWKGD